MKWLAGVVAFGAINFFSCMLIAKWIGGDAVNGKIVDGHYFLRDHGHYIEVSAAVFTYSLWHVRSFFVTNPIAGVASLWLFLLLRRRNSA